MSLNETGIGGVKEAIVSSPRRRRLQPPQVRGRRPSRPARPGDRVERPDPHLDRHRDRACPRPTRSRSRSTRTRTSGSTSSARRDRAASPSTRPTPRCGSPTCRPGLVVEIQDEKSQHKNKAKAMSVLRSRLLERELAEQREAESATRRSMVGSGDRSEKIRTYNFPQDRVTDHRIGMTVHNLPGVLDGEIDRPDRRADHGRPGGAARRGHRAERGSLTRWLVPRRLAASPAGSSRTTSTRPRSAGSIRSPGRSSRQPTSARSRSSSTATCSC